MTFDRRTVLLAPVFTLGALSLGAMSPEPMPAQVWTAGTHPVSDDPIWNLLAAAKVQTDLKSGRMTAAFTDDVKKMAGKTVSVEGFMQALTPGRQTVRFTLTRRNSGCPFCPPNQPTEAVEIIATRPVKLTNDLITMSGKLSLNTSSDQGLFYELSLATPA